jgi:predicted secreted hydrolase
LQLDVQPVIDDQELGAIVAYWEGAVDVVGNRNGEKLGGRGYVELTGYARISEQEVED